MKIYRNPRESWTSDPEENGYRRGPSRPYRDAERRNENRREWNQTEYRSAPPSARDYIDEQNELYDWFDRDHPEYAARGYFGTGNYAGIDEFAPMTRYRGGHFYGGRQRDDEYMGYGAGPAYA